MKTFATFLCFPLFILSSLAQNPGFTDIQSCQKPELSFLFNNGFISPLQTKHKDQIISRSQTERLDSSHYWEWNYLGQHWNPIARAFFKENSNGDITHKLELRFRNGQWENNRIDSTVYNANNEVTHEISLLWKGANWDNWIQTIYTYDINDNLTEMIIQNWEDTIWVNLFKLTYTYDSDHKILTNSNFTWLGDEWTSPGRLLYIYSTGNQLDTLLGQDFVSGEWHDSGRTVYAYDINNRVILTQIQKLDELGTWGFDYQLVYSYGNATKNVIYQEYVNGEWISTSNNIVNYTANNNVLSQLSQFWDNGWANRDTSQYYYTTTTGISNLSNELNISVYPNPATTYLEIQSEPGQTGEISFEIYSNTGIKVMESNGKMVNQKKIDISKLSPGLYHVVIQNDTRIQVRNFVKL